MSEFTELGPIAFTSRSGVSSESRYIEVYLGEEMLSRHINEAEAIETVIEHLHSLPPGDYEFEFRTPNRVMSVRLLDPRSGGQGTGQEADITPPLPPVGLSLSDFTETSVLVSWASNSDPAIDEYRVYKSTTSKDSGFIRIDEDGVSHPTVSFVDFSYNPAIQQWYRVTAVDQAGNQSSLSDPVTDTTAPDAPVAPTVSGETATSITINLPSSAAIDHASWQVWTAPSGGTLTLRQSGVTSATYQVTSLDPDTFYDIALKDVDVSGNPSAIGAIRTHSTSAATGSMNVGTLSQEAETPHQVALIAPVVGAGVASDATARIEYRLNGSGAAYTEAHPLFLSLGDYFAGCIFDLEPGETYDYRVTYAQTGVTDVRTGTFTTRALPDIAGTPDYTPSTDGELSSALSSVQPGEVIELQDGNYSAFAVTTNGTEANPIYVRGESIDGVVVSGSMDLDADWIVLENMTIDGGARPVRLNVSGTGTDNCVIRDLKVINSARCIATAGGSSGPLTHGILVYNVQGTGALEWTANDIFFDSNWSDDGIRLVGHGNCVWNCTLEGYSDTITWAHSDSGDQPEIYANFAYRNFIRNNSDDVFELDHSLRQIGMYDNYIENCRQGWSQSDQGSAGPVYLFRNIWVNIGNRPFKLNSSWSGWHVYSNTMLRADSPDGTLPGSGNPESQKGWFIWDSAPTENQERAAIRNNLFIYRGTKTGDAGHGFWTVRWGDFGEGIDHSHNAHFPDLTISWDSFASNKANLAQAISESPSTTPTYPASAGLGAPTTLYDATHKISESDPFETPITMGSDAVTEVTGMTIPRIASGRAPKNAGVHIPGITDDFSGAAPDIGAIIEGRTVPNYGFHDPELSATALGQFSSGLSSNTTTTWNPGKNPRGLDRAEISWMAEAVFFDPTRLELSICTKEANKLHSSYINTLRDTSSNNGWTETGLHAFKDSSETSNSGHIWNACFDYETGDYFFHTQVHDRLYWYDRSASQWKETVAATGTDPFVDGTTGACGGIALHPNGLGPGQKCLFVFSQRGGSTGNGRAFYKAEPFDSGNWVEFSPGVPIAKYGQAIYVPGQDAVVFGGGSDHSSTNSPTPAQQLRSLSAGSGGSPGSITNLGNAPQHPGGAAGGREMGVMCIDPLNDAHLLLFERFLDGSGSQRVWRSTDGGDNWSQIGNHNFQGLLDGSSNGLTCTGVPGLGIVIGFTSRPNVNPGTYGGDPNAWSCAVYKV